MRHAATVAAGDVGGEIRDRASADSDDGLAAAIDGKVVQFTNDGQKFFHVLVFFTTGTGNDLGVLRVMIEVVAHGITVETVHIFIDDDEAPIVTLQAWIQQVQVGRIQDIGRVDDLVVNPAVMGDAPVLIADLHIADFQVSLEPNNRWASFRASTRL